MHTIKKYFLNRHNRSIILCSFILLNSNCWGPCSRKNDTAPKPPAFNNGQMEKDHYKKKFWEIEKLIKELFDKIESIKRQQLDIRIILTGLDDLKKNINSKLIELQNAFNNRFQLLANDINDNIKKESDDIKEKQKLLRAKVLSSLDKLDVISKDIECIKNIKEKIQKLEKTTSGLEEDKKGLNNVLEEQKNKLIKKITDLTNTNEIKQNELTEVKNQFSEKNNEITQANNNFNTAEKEKNELKKEIEDKNKEIDNLKTLNNKSNAIQQDKAPVQQSGTGGGGSNGNGEEFFNSKVNEEIKKQLTDIETKLNNNELKIEKVNNKVDANKIEQNLIESINNKENKLKDQLYTDLSNSLPNWDVLKNRVIESLCDSLQKMLAMNDKGEYDDLAKTLVSTLMEPLKNELTSLVSNVLNNVLDFSNESSMVSEEQSNIIYNYISTLKKDKNLKDKNLCYNACDALYDKNIKAKIDNYNQAFNKKLCELLSQTDTVNDIINKLISEINNLYIYCKSTLVSKGKKTENIPPLNYLFTYALNKNPEDRNKLFKSLATDTLSAVISIVKNNFIISNNIISDYADNQINLRIKSELARSLVRVIVDKLVDQSKEPSKYSNDLKDIIFRKVLSHNQTKK